MPGLSEGDTLVTYLGLHACMHVSSKLAAAHSVFLLDGQFATIKGHEARIVSKLDTVAVLLGAGIEDADCVLPLELTHFQTLLVLACLHEMDHLLV